MSEPPNHDEKEVKEIFHLREADDHHNIDKIKIPVSSDNNIQISFLQFFKHSRFIQNEYLQNEIIDKITNRLQQYQSEFNIKKENISTFFKLLEDEQIEVSSDQYCDLCKLSEIFEVESLQKLLDNYLENHSQNTDLMINLMIDQISSENFDFFSRNQITVHIEKYLRNSINKCITNENFGKLPCSTIYRIFEKSDTQQISSDILYDFISKCIDERFLLFCFLNIRNLSDEKVNDMCLHYDNLKESNSMRYYDYLKIDFGYIKELREDIQKSKNQIGMLSEKNGQLVDRNIHMQNQFNELEILKNQLQAQIKELTNENKEIKAQNEQMKEEKSQLQIHVKIINTENNEIKKQKKQIEEVKDQLEIQINNLTKENNEIKTQKQKLEQAKNELEVQIKNHINKINEDEVRKQQIDNEKRQLQDQINKLTKENNEIKSQNQQVNEEKRQLQDQINKLTKEINDIKTQNQQANEEKIQLQDQINKDKNQEQAPIKQPHNDENHIINQQLEEYKKINSVYKEKEMHKYFELIKELLSHVSDIEKVSISGIFLFFFFNRTILHFACETGNIELVKYIISLDKIDVNSKDIIICYFIAFKF